jgi:hypothetical protein
MDDHAGGGSRVGTDPMTPMPYGLWDDEYVGYGEKRRGCDAPSLGAGAARRAQPGLTASCGNPGTGHTIAALASWS